MSNPVEYRCECGRMVYAHQQRALGCCFCTCFDTEIPKGEKRLDTTKIRNYTTSVDVQRNRVDNQQLALDLLSKAVQIEVTIVAPEEIKGMGRRNTRVILTNPDSFQHCRKMIEVEQDADRSDLHACERSLLDLVQTEYQETACGGTP